jgi:hypothetical protein
VRLVHEPADGGERTLATSVSVADGPLSRARGQTFRREPTAMAFRFRRVGTRRLHMLFVPFPLDAVWAVEGRVSRVQRLRPWVGRGRGTGDLVVELPAGDADGVEEGDRIRLS